MAKGPRHRLQRLGTPTGCLDPPAFSKKLVAGVAALAYRLFGHRIGRGIQSGFGPSRRPRCTEGAIGKGTVLP